MSGRFIALGLSLVVFSVSLNAEEVSVDGQIQQLELSVANLPKMKVDLTLNKIRDAIEAQTKVHVLYGSSYEDNLRILRVLRKYRMNAELAGIWRIYLHASSTRESSECRIEIGLSCYIRKGASEQEILNLFRQSYGALAATSEEEWMDILRKIGQYIDGTEESDQPLFKQILPLFPLDNRGIGSLVARISRLSTDLILREGSMGEGMRNLQIDLTLIKIRDAIKDQTKVHVFYGSSYEDNLRILRVLRKYRMSAELAGVGMIWLHASSTRNSSECRIESGLSCYIRRGASEQEILSLLHQSYGELVATTEDEWMDILKQVALEIENTGKTKQRIGKKD